MPILYVLQRLYEVTITSEPNDLILSVVTFHTERYRSTRHRYINTGLYRDLILTLTKYTVGLLVLHLHLHGDVHGFLGFGISISDSLKLCLCEFERCIEVVRFCYFAKPVLYNRSQVPKLSLRTRKTSLLSIIIEYKMHMHYMKRRDNHCMYIITTITITITYSAALLP